MKVDGRIIPIQSTNRVADGDFLCERLFVGDFFVLLDTIYSLCYIIRIILVYFAKNLSAILSMAKNVPKVAEPLVRPLLIQN